GAAPDQAGDAAADEEAEPPGPMAILGELLLLVVKLPFLIGFESPMTFVLVAIALWEAWKLNVEAPFEASGPFAVGADAAARG
ncbi:MAG TPA: hypothetical protein VFP50_13705, partial [Anaeromyxobacteraceae bacterium]|nr:hypothetical protein [Anaeromyxobacteraceae bacterium]